MMTWSNRQYLQMHLVGVVTVEAGPWTDYWLAPVSSIEGDDEVC